MYVIVKKREVMMLINAVLAVAAVFCVLASSGTLSAAFAAYGESRSVPIIMYHHITEDPSQVNDYTVLLSDFERDLDYIREMGYSTVSVSDLADYVNGVSPLPRKTVVITFDDGFESFYVYAYPSLRERGMKAVLAVVGGYADRYTESEDHNVAYSYLTWDEIAELSQSGAVEIQNHTYDMHSISGGARGSTRLSGEDASAYCARFTDDVEKNHRLILEHTGVSPNAMVYPFGFYCDLSEQEIQRMGYAASFTCEERINEIKRGDGASLYRLGRFNRVGGAAGNRLLARLLGEDMADFN